MESEAALGRLTMRSPRVAQALFAAAVELQLVVPTSLAALYFGCRHHRDGGIAPVIIGGLLLVSGGLQAHDLLDEAGKLAERVAAD